MDLFTSSGPLAGTAKKPGPIAGPETDARMLQPAKPARRRLISRRTMGVLKRRLVVRVN